MKKPSHKKKPWKPRIPFYELLAPRNTGTRFINRHQGDLVYYCCLYQRALPDGKILHYDGADCEGTHLFAACDDDSAHPVTFIVRPAISGNPMKAGMRFGCLRPQSDGVHYEMEDVVFEIGRVFPWLIVENQEQRSKFWGLEGVN